ncbi:HAMP domain-containing sensor histidine kinase [Isoptericola sp. b515]|uniref:sensor histidine kinase n=1 Tax=Isoptericola sp. b515 TaxID=3064652 RepID=UPI0027124A7E|nr:HAMP domain-containing sensor histidine kinase [Isoptericola sp. b515]MDO8147468.1 HAMP domain-containing sensor histidine kinase [Isoptericola sp. b515]
MRARLTALVYVPIALVLLLVGLLYAASVTRAQQQDIFLDRLRDASYLSLTARQAILADDPAIVAVDLERYREVYGVRSAVVDQAGVTLASAGLDVEHYPERHTAVAGRRSEMAASFWPWDVDEIVVAEPVFDGEDVVGALVSVSDTRALERSIWLSWGLLTAGGVAVALLAVLVADRTAGWVLRPVRVVDAAMERMGSGRLDERIPPSTGPPELREVVTRFNEMAERVEHLMRRQQEFVANASHELRNPLNALMLRIEGLALTVPSEQVEDVEHVRAEAVRMARILDALLLLAEDGSSGTAQPVDLVELATRRIEGWRLLEDGREVRLATPDRPVWAAIDPTALGTALDTIVDNALKFSPASEPLEITVADVEGRCEIVVRDHGPGVAPDQLERLTERFWRSPGHSNVRGSGLGLAIASELLASAGGGLRLELPDDGGLRAHLQVRPWDEEQP